MGIFGKAVDARTQSVLRSHFGRDITYEFVSGGKGSADGLPVSLSPFMCALYEDGLIFIHEGRVALTLLWKQVINISDFGSTLTADVILPFPNSFKSHFEFPYNSIFNLYLSFNNQEHGKIILSRFKEALINDGATEEGLTLAKTWDKMAVKRPVSFEEYIKANVNWKVDEAVKVEAREAWGEVLEAEKFLYFIAGGICRGRLAPQLIDVAMDIFISAHEVNSKFTMQEIEISAENKKLTDDLKRLVYLPDSRINDWVAVKLEYHFDEPKPMINSGNHWSLLGVLNSQGLNVSQVWDFYNQGTEYPFLVDAKSTTEVSGHLIADSRKFIVSGNQVKLFNKLLR
jgi:hypothetical protein